MNIQRIYTGKVWLLCLAILVTLGYPNISQAYSYQNNEFSFRIECPQKPGEVLPITDAQEKGVALNFASNAAEPLLWLIQVRAGDFFDPRLMSSDEVKATLAELRKLDYGEGKICDSAELVEVGKYQGVLLLLHDEENRLAISMVKTDRGTYLLTLVGDLRNKSAFEKNLLLYKKGIASFENL